jgi:calcium-dependent protein kinase
MNTKMGTAYYVAPEIVNGRAEREGYDKSVDVWALGLVFDELLHGSPFFNGATEEEVFNKIRNETYFIRNKEYRESSFFDGNKFIVQQILINMIQ